MKLKLGLLGEALLCLLLSGCATNIGLTYQTQPAGALLSYMDGTQQVGLSPVRMNYVWDEKFVSNGCLHTKGVTAQWVSGARVSSPQVITICKQSGEFTYNLPRPTDAPGLEKDMQFALEVERTRIMQQQAETANQQTQLQMIQMFNSIQPKTTTGTIIGPAGNYFYQQTTR